MFGAILKGASALIRPVVGNAAVKGLVKKTALGATAYTLGNSIGGMLGGGGKGAAGLPALPGAAGLPALPGLGAPAIVGKRGIFRNDANVPAAIEQFAISKGDLRQSFRSPIPGYVVVRDQAGDPVAVPKFIAKAYFGWRPSKKPPISVGDWEAVKRADRTIKKVRKITATMTKVDKATRGGKVVIHKRKKGE